jgi:hypothetical protein
MVKAERTLNREVVGSNSNTVYLMESIRYLFANTLSKEKIKKIAEWSTQKSEKSKRECQNAIFNYKMNVDAVFSDGTVVAIATS